MATRKPVIIQIEKLGTVHRWEFYQKPMRGNVPEQKAYERGFRARVEDVNQGRHTPLYVDFRRKSDEKAYWLGYNDARAQEPIDTRNVTTAKPSSDFGA